MTLENFDTHLAKYAELIIKKGINITNKQTLIITISVEQTKFARLLTHYAYKAGAKKVFVDYTDDVILKEELLYATDDVIDSVPQFLVDKSLYLLNEKASRLVVRSNNPNAFATVDSDRLARHTKALALALTQQRQASQSNQISWCLVAAAGKEQAKLVFPNLNSQTEQLDALWDTIFKLNRVYDENPIEAWETHEKLLIEKANILNEAQFDALHYTAPGTDLTLGLPKNHIWEAAGSYNAQGQHFIANMPTEEVFTAPDYKRADGYVSSTKPLSYAGVIIEDMKFTFKDGKIIEATAKTGEKTLKKLITENEGAKSLGEVALVPHKTPISLSGLTFFNTLFDENASNHLAIGQAYAFSVKNGTNMSQEELKEAGLNRSSTHVDFMIGSDKMDIDGITKDGQRIPIFRQGEWAI